MSTVDIAPPNSLLLVMDPSVGQIPEGMSDAIVASTASCVAIGTLSEHDGTTRVSISDNAVTETNDAPVFDGVLDTPGGRIAVCSVFDQIILEIAVATARTRVRIYANDNNEPSEI